jgi:hypothetical protein
MMIVPYLESVPIIHGARVLEGIRRIYTEGFIILCMIFEGALGNALRGSRRELI